MEIKYWFDFQSYFVITSEAYVERMAKHVQARCGKSVYICSSCRWALSSRIHRSPCMNGTFLKTKNYMNLQCLKLCFLSNCLNDLRKYVSKRQKKSLETVFIVIDCVMKPLFQLVNDLYCSIFPVVLVSSSPRYLSARCSNAANCFA